MTSFEQVDSVYAKLCNELPKVDPLILKAVALENNTDCDAAFLVMVDEVLPYIPEVTNSSNLGKKNWSSQPIGSAEAAEEKVAQEVDSTLSFAGLLVPKHAGTSATPMPELDAQKCLQEVAKINNTDKIISFCKGLANHLNVMPEKISRLTSLHEDLEGKFISDNLPGENCHASFMAEKIVPLTETNDFPAFVSCVIGQPDENLVFGNGIASVEAADRASGLCMVISEVEQEDLIDVSDSEMQQDNSDKHWFDVKNKVPGNGIVFLPSQTKKIQLLELSIEEAKTIKRTLNSSLEAVRNTLRKVEDREKAAEKAKEEASEGGREIFSQAEELKTMLQKAKEDTDVRAGEVYGEMSILAAEAMELQSRLASMAEERDSALCILDEMHCSLELRLSAADEEIRKAEEEKQNKEITAKTYFNELEAIMDKIIQEAKVLRLEAEENSKLRESLVDRGRAVDALQGEIGVICQDVESLKCKFDERVPLDEYVSSSQSTCILAASTSSIRSISSQVLSDQEALSEPSSSTKQPTEFDEDGWEFV